MPPSAFGLVGTTLDEITRESGGGKLSFGILLTLVTASTAMVSIIEALNTAYSVKEVRPWWQRRLVALVLTLVLAVFTLSALAFLLYGGQIGHLLASHVGFEHLFLSVWTLARWPLVVVFVLLAFALIYRFAPNLEEQKWRWVLPGTIAAFLLWMVASFGLQLYLRFFDTYSRVYGSLGALMILMLWLYLFGAAILIGGEVNSVLESAAARAGDPEAKLPGEKAPGESAA
jgi:membrane protein